MEANARDWKGLCLFAFLVPFSGFYFIPRAPLTFLRVVRAFRATAKWGRDFIAFGPLDFGFRPWYAKLARDIRTSGRFGIVWDDGYGQPLGTRFYNNFITYRLYEWLGVRRYALASVVLYLASVAAILTSIGGDWRMAIVVTLLIAASPLFLASQLHLGKPEIFWWFLLPWGVVLCGRGQFLAAGVLFTIIAFANFATAFFSGLTLVVAAAAFGMSVSSVGMLLIGMSPGLVKTFLRLIPFLRSGALRGLVTTQVDVVRPRAGRRRAFPAITAGVIYSAILFAIALFLTARAPIALAVAIIGGVAIIAYGLAQSVISLNDPQSFRMWHLSLLVSFVALRPSWLGVLGVVLLAYMDAGYAGTPPVGRDLVVRGGVLATLSAYGRDALAFGRHFPALAPVATNAIEPVIDRFFSAIPAGSRIIFEASGDRAVSGYRAFLVVCDGILPQRGIEMLPDEYVRLTLRFYERAHGAFNEASNSKTLAHVIETVGASHAIAHTTALAEALRAMGCEEIARLRISELPAEIASLLRLPPADLVLFRASGSTVTPRAMFSTQPNAITWPAAAGQTYVVRYRYHQQFEASQGSTKLVVRAQRVDDTDLEITTIESATDEPITLRFLARML